MTDPRPAEQLNLALPADPAMGRGDFLEAAPNALALAALEGPARLPEGLSVLIGPAGSGKTHLARIWAARTGAHWQPVATLRADLPKLLAHGGPEAIVIDDAHTLAGTAGEEALFHLVNHLRAHGQLLLTAPVPVRDWGLRLPDLVSRLSAAAHPTLAEPDEALLAAVLVKLFNDRQVRVDPPLIDFLLGRMERSLAAARALVARLDQIALQRQRRITRDLAREVLVENEHTEGLDNADQDRAS